MSQYFVVIPAYNEAKRIRRCVEHILSYTRNVIVVDDGSTDATGALLDSIDGIRVIHLKKNEGKGHAMKVGAKEAWRRGASGILFMDGDNQHHPKHIVEFVRKLKDGNDIVIGVRLLRAAIPLHRKIGNLLMVSAMRLLFHIDIPDMMCGYRAFSRKGYRKIVWTSPGYGVETEVLAIVGRKKLPFRTVVVDTIYLDKYKGFSIRDGLRIVKQLPYFRMRKL